MALLIPTSVMDRMGVIKVTDYGAVGDGTTDDYASIKSAVEYALANGSRYTNFTFVYMPPGTYITSDTIEGRVATASGPNDSRWRAGFVLWSVDPDNTTLKLQANASGFNTTTLKPVVKWGSESDTLNPQGGGNRAFRHGGYHFRLDLNGNTGAIGLDFHASNRGALEDLYILNSVKSGAGIYCSRTNNGPALISDVTVEKCDSAIFLEGYTYNVILKDVTVRDQGTVGVDVENANLTAEGLESYNNVLAVRATGNQSFVSLYNSKLQLHTGQSRSSLYGVQSAGRVEIDGLASNAYNTVVRNTLGGTVDVAESSLPTVNGFPTVDRFTTYVNKSLFISNPKTLQPKAAPDAWSSNTADWAVYGDYGGVGTLQQLQNTIDAGRKFVALPVANYVIDGDLYIRDITKLIGFQSAITAAANTTPTIYFDGSSADGFTVLEHLRIVGCKVVHRSTDQLHVKHVDLNAGYENTSAGTGDVFFTDVICSPVKIGHLQNAYATQLNSEYQPVLVEVDNATLRMHGYKTETASNSGQINLKAINGAKVQATGMSTYSLGSGPNNTTPKTASFVLEDVENALLSWNVFDASRGYHDVQVRETIAGVTRELPSTQLNGASPTCVSYSGGLQNMQTIFAASAPYNASGSNLVSSNPGAYNGLTNANFIAEYNPNGYTLDASTGVVTITGTNLGGRYRVDLTGGFYTVSSANIVTLAASIVRVTHGTTTISKNTGRDTAGARSVGVSGLSFFTIPDGVTSFSFTPQFYTTTSPAYGNMSISELIYSLSYLGPA